MDLKTNGTNSMKEDKLVATIKVVRNMVREGLEGEFGALPKDNKYRKYNEHKYKYINRYNYDRKQRIRDIKTISDALVYIVMSRMDEKNRTNLEEIKKHPLIKAAMNDEISSKLFFDDNTTKVTFQSSIDGLLNGFGIKKSPNDDIQRMIDSDVLKDKPDIRLALQMYAMKGMFNWVNNVKSEFTHFLFDTEKTSLDPKSSINCWEAVFYGFYKAKLISKEDLKTYYDEGPLKAPNKLTDLFDFASAKKLFGESKEQASWKDVLSKKTYFIMMGEPGSKGMDHDMISFPYSQKQFLKMLITKDFNVENYKPKLYSHWIDWTNGSLNVVPKKEFNRMLENKYSTSETRVSPALDIVDRIKQRAGKSELTMGL